jgi:hypothetical protein
MVLSGGGRLIDLDRAPCASPGTRNRETAVAVAACTDYHRRAGVPAAGVTIIP